MTLTSSFQVFTGVPRASLLYQILNRATQTDNKPIIIDSILPKI